MTRLPIENVEADTQPSNAGTDCHINAAEICHNCVDTDAEPELLGDGGGPGSNNAISPVDAESALPETRSKNEAELTVEAILNTSPKLSVSLSEEALIELPLQPSPSQTPSVWPLRNERVKAEIAALAWQTHNIVLPRYVIDRVTNVLEGLAWKNFRGKFSRDAVLDDHPLVEALYIYLKQASVGGHVRDSCSKILTDLDSIALRHRINTNSKEWPKGAPQLSCLVKKMAPILETIGIRTWISRYGGGNRFLDLTLKNCDDSVSPLSQPPSAINCLHEGETRGCDDGDAELNSLLARIELKTKGLQNDSPEPTES